MKAVICIKPVLARYVKEENSDDSKWMINPYDLFVLNRLVQLRETCNRLHITCLSMGPISSKEVLTRCFALGADEGVLLCDEQFAGSDTYATAYILSAAIRKLNYDMVVCGKKTVDGETGQVGYGLAYRLEIPHFQQVEEILKLEEDGVVFSRLREPYLETLEAKLPIMLSFQKSMTDCNVSLFRLKKAGGMPVKVWNGRDINADPRRCGSRGSKTKVQNLHQTFQKKDPVILHGSREEKARDLLRIINQSATETFYE